MSDLDPVILDCKFSELGLVLVVPCAKSSSLFFCESSGTGECILSAVAHLDVLADIVLIGHFSISLNHSELLFVLSHGH